MSKLAFGTTFTWNSQTVAKLTSIGGVELNIDMVDVTTHQSTSGFREVLPGLADAGEVALEGNFDYTDTAGQQAMVTDAAAKTSRTGVITFPAATGTTWTFTGYISKIKIGDNPIDGKIPFSASVKITGVPTLAVATVTGMSAIGFSNDVLMMPAFAIGTLGPYVVTITAGQTSTIITPVDATGGEIITIYTDGGSAQVVATGEASTPCTLDVDDTTVITVVISHATKASKTYTFNLAVLAA